MPNRNFVAPFAAILLTLSGIASAQTSAKSLVQPRISAAIDDSSRVTLSGSHSSHALAANDVGVVPGNTPISGVTVVFSRSAAQQSALNALIAAQQNPSSPQYHQWLTPAQFGAQFGVADADLSATQSWLQSKGFTIGSVSPARNSLAVSGTAAQIASAFGTSLHYYKSSTDTEAHYAPATDLTLPAALAPVVLSVNNLSTFRLKPQMRLRPAFTSGTSPYTGYHFLQPGDVSVIYDINAAYNSGYTGSGVSIAIVGQSAIVNSDITAFQAAASIPVRAPTSILIPGSGASTAYDGDEAESDLDLEYSSSIAKGASVYFVYTGSNANYGVFDSLNYAVQQNLAPIISISYGGCEAGASSDDISSLESIGAQAASQGQTIIAASGDAGSTGCNGETTLSTAQQLALSVDYPASSAYVTALGGSEFPLADTANSNSTYFTPASGSDVITSAKSYIPEMVWNDDSSSSTQISSGGGGTSIYVSRPSWQAGTIGGVAIPSGSYRLVPDISLDASNESAPYIFCSSDTSSWNTAANGGVAPYQQSSCTSGFHDSSTQDLNLAGGTSFAAPIFAGMTALLVQATGGAGLGLLNPMLYTLAANSVYYNGTTTSAFHDITTGSNECLGASSVCSGPGASTNYVATTGYDEASGLGSIDLNNLINAFLTTNISTKNASKVTLAPTTTTPLIGATDPITITVANNGTGIATPTGSVTITVDGNSAGSFNLTSGAYTYNFSSTISGTHTITATYSGDSNYNQSTGTLFVTVAGSFSLSAAPSTITVAPGANGTSTITVTPAQGYIGTVDFSATASASLNDSCYDINNVSITSTAAVSTTLTLYTSVAACNNVAATGVQAYRIGAPGSHVRQLWTAPPTVTPTASNHHSRPGVPSGIAFGGSVLMLALLRRRKLGRRLTSALSLGLVLVLGLGALGLTGCSSSSTTVVPPTNGGGGNQAAGTYTITLIGSDSFNGTLSSSTNITLTVN